MNNADQIKALLSSFAAQLPILLVCLVAAVVILIKWKQAPRGRIWALLGFGFTFILCFFIPIMQTGVQRWVMDGGGGVANRAAIFTGLSILWSGLRAVTYALLLVAVYAGRPVSRPV